MQRRHAIVLGSIVSLLPGLAAAESRATLLPATAAPAVVEQCSRAVPRISGTWKVRDRDVKLLETDLRQIQGRRAEACCNWEARLDDPRRYYRQYAGVVREGRRLIYLNAFPSPPPPDWREVPVIACGGGNDYWGVLYDPQSRAFLQLAFNGTG